MVELDEAWESERLRAVLNRLMVLIEKKGFTAQASIASEIGVESHYLGRTLLGRVKRVNPLLIRRLAELAEVPTTEIFTELGWLGPDARKETDALTDLSPYHASSAVSAAVAAVIEDGLDGAERFRVLRSSVVSGDRYRSVTNHVAEFLLNDGQEPWPWEHAARLAEELGIEAGEHPGAAAAAALRLELKVRTHAALRDCVEYSWQGDAGNLTWRSAAAAWPTQLLVHDPIGGSQLPAGPGPVSGFAEDTLVVVGGRHSLGLAAPILAEALGHRFVLIRPDLGITDQGEIFPVRRDDAPGRSQAWMDVAIRLKAAYAAAAPWPLVVQVRPAVFNGTTAGRHALRLLASTPARVLYARPPEAYVRWWSRRIAGNHLPGAYDADAWAAQTLAQYAEIETVLADRPGNRTLLLEIPPPTGTLEPHHPRVPAEVLDWTVRVAWTAARWLADGHVPPLARGRLASWRPDLESDPLADVAPLTDLL